ncbi:hypothetical protein [Streptomyces sp. AcE210]|uniref:hypothetical protein n=1 Tax=Streptomyces sp. AcE210 TaxID=2292703 RepID=UPI000E303085|nr:hypothetical protein [Streptomyces sp. AcE210]RFC70782.1 hypothetical protein DXZ75_26260 [Streptomyces sp. AcE210]
MLGSPADRVMRAPGLDTVLLALVPTAVAEATGDHLIRSLTGTAYGSLRQAIVAPRGGRSLVDQQSNTPR